MNKSQTVSIEMLYSSLSVGSLIRMCNEVQPTIEPEQLEKRTLSLISHVRETYNGEAFHFTFENKCSSRIRKMDYWAESTYHPIIKTKRVNVFSYGNSKDIMHLLSTLHEIGHGIDFLKRSNPKTFMDNSNKAVTIKEARAWAFGLRLGLLTGHISRQELDDNFVRCMICLASYLKAFEVSTEDFLKVCDQVYNKIVE